MFRKGENSNSGLRCEDGDDGWTRWSFNWDTTQFKDDEYRISVRVVSAVGVVSDEIRRVVTVDNIDPMPDLLFVSKSISVQEFGIPMQESYVNTFLEVRATIRNTGDQAATDVGIILEEWERGGTSTSYPILTLASLSKWSFIGIQLNPEMRF